MANARHNDPLNLEQQLNPEQKRKINEFKASFIVLMKTGQTKMNRVLDAIDHLLSDDGPYANEAQQSTLIQVFQSQGLPNFFAYLLKEVDKKLGEDMKSRYLLDQSMDDPAHEYGQEAIIKQISIQTPLMPANMPGNVVYGQQLEVLSAQLDNYSICLEDSQRAQRAMISIASFILFCKILARHPSFLGSLPREQRDISAVLPLHAELFLKELHTLCTQDADMRFLFPEALMARMKGLVQKAKDALPALEQGLTDEQREKFNEWAEKSYKLRQDSQRRLAIALEFAKSFSATPAQLTLLIDEVIARQKREGVSDACFNHKLFFYYMMRMKWFFLMFDYHLQQLGSVTQPFIDDQIQASRKAFLDALIAEIQAVELSQDVSSQNYSHSLKQIHAHTQSEQSIIQMHIKAVSHMIDYELFWQALVRNPPLLQQLFPSGCFEHHGHHRFVSVEIECYLPMMRQSYQEQGGDIDDLFPEKSLADIESLRKRAVSAHEAAVREIEKLRAADRAQQAPRPAAAASAPLTPLSFAQRSAAAWERARKRVSLPSAMGVFAVSADGRQIEVRATSILPPLGPGIPAGFGQNQP
jgi:hypothetical protein